MLILIVVFFILIAGVGLAYYLQQSKYKGAYNLKKNKVGPTGDHAMDGPPAKKPPNSWAVGEAEWDKPPATNMEGFGEAGDVFAVQPGDDGSSPPRSSASRPTARPASSSA